MTRGEQSAIEIEVATVSVVNAAGARPESTWINDKIDRFWIAEKHEEHRVAPVPAEWAVSRNCTAIVQTLVTLADLDAIGPTPSVDIVDARKDGATYVIEGAGVHVSGKNASTVHLTNDVDSPAATVVIAAFAAWAPCWSDAPPKLED